MRVTRHYKSRKLCCTTFVFPCRVLWARIRKILKDRIYIRTVSAVEDGTWKEISFRMQLCKFKSLVWRSDTSLWPLQKKNRKKCLARAHHAFTVRPAQLNVCTGVLLYTFASSKTAVSTENGWWTSIKTKTIYKNELKRSTGLVK